MKRLFVFLLILLFIPYSVFANLSPWAQDDFSKADSLGFISDDPDIYDYTAGITRVKFCELGYDFLKMCVSAKINHLSATYGFVDTSNQKVLYLADAGIIAGRGDGIFAPDDLITREEAASILVRMADFMGYQLPSALLCDYYTDFESISEWAQGDVAVMYEMGVMNGVNDTEFSPKTHYTAEQAVSTMVRLFEFFEAKLLFVDGETMVTPDFFVKYNTSFSWVEKSGVVLHKSALSQAYGYKCYFSGDNIRVAVLLRSGITEVYDASCKNLLFTLPGLIKYVDDNGLTVVNNDSETEFYPFEGK